MTTDDHGRWTLRRTATRAGALVAALTLLTCARTAPDPSEVLTAPQAATSGRRLRLVWWEGADKTRLLRRGNTTGAASLLFDAERNEFCEVQRSRGGVLRCLPSAERSSYASLVYADPACAMPIARSFDVDRPAPAYAWEVTPCDNVTSIARVLQPRTDTSFYQRTALGECLPTARGESRLYDVENVPLSAFATVTEQLAPGPGRIRSMWQSSADGMRLPRSFFDTELDVACEGTRQCAPSSGLGIGVGLDARCSQLGVSYSPYAYAPLDGCRAPRFAWFNPHPACPQLAFYTAVLEQVPNPPRYYRLGVSNTCLASSEPAQVEQTYRAGPVLSLARIDVDREDTREAPAGKVLARKVYRSGTSSLPSADELYDIERNEACAPYDNQVQTACVTRTDFLLTDRFIDPTCSKPVTMYLQYACEDRSPPTNVRVHRRTSNGVVTDVFARGARVDGPIYLKGANGCREESWAEVSLYLLGSRTGSFLPPKLVEVVDR